MSANQWKSNQQWGADQRGRSGGWQEHRSGGWETDHRSDRSGGCAGDRNGNWAGDHSGGWTTYNRNHRSGGWVGDHSGEWKENNASWDQLCKKEEWNKWPEVKSDWAGQASGWGQLKNNAGATGSGSPIDEDDPRWDTVVDALANYQFQQIQKEEAQKDAAAVAAQAKTTLEPWPVKWECLSTQHPWECLSTPDAPTDGAAVAAPQSRAAAQQEGPRQEDAAQQESAPQEGPQQEGPQQNEPAVAASQDGGGAQRDGAAVAAPQIGGAVQANDVIAALEADGMIQVYEPTVADNGRFCFDIPYFQGYRHYSDGYKQHNLSLKYFRDVAENKESPMSSVPLKFPFDGWVSTKAVVHD